MERNIYNLLLKSILAVTLFVFQQHAFSQNTYYSTINTSASSYNYLMAFEDPYSWSNQGQKPSLDELNGKILAHFIVQTISNPRYSYPIVMVISENTKMASLTIQSFSSVTVKDCKVEINGTLIMEGNANLDFGNLGSTLTVGGDLTGLDSKITHNANAGKTDSLILKGASNTLKQFDISKVYGTSIVSYIRDGDQTLFGCNQYQNLILGGLGTKTLTAPPDKTDTKIINSLSITNCILQLNDLDLAYAGTEANLTTNKGWIQTNGAGFFRNTNTTGNETTKTYPVGSATAMQKITLSGSAVRSNDIGIRFDPSMSNTGALAANGMGAWNLNVGSQSNGITLTATINPTADNPKIISLSSRIASFDGTTNSTWSVHDTKFSSIDTSFTSTSLFTLNNGNTWLMLFNCPVYTITPTTIPSSYAGNVFNDQQFFVTSNNNAVSDINNLRMEKQINDFSFTSGFLKCTLSPPKPPLQKIPFTLIYTDINLCGIAQAYTLRIIDKPSPNLSILPIGDKTFGTDSFKVNIYTRSTGKIIYSIAPTECASIDQTTGFIKINCAGPSPNNLITVTATQESDGMYTAESVSKSFIINPASGRLYIKNYAFLTNNQQTRINVATKQINAALSFDQLNGLGVAMVTPAGIVTTNQSTGEFKVQISLAATANYTAFDSVYTFNVYTLDKPPIAIGDTIVLDMGKDSTFNILLNDRGETSEIVPNKTDIDIDNSGQQIKYYATELGNFTIDTLGNLTINPFVGFIGSGRLGYTITDLNGLSSEVDYVEITIKSPFVIPELKANDVMTPNNDNLNDALVIANTDLNKENSLMIMDELGNAVYEKADYQNDWKGVNGKNNKLEPGIYFYVFKEKNTGRELKNYIQIL